jgi:C-terminal processing protease CtpA/Prc
MPASPDRLGYLRLASFTQNAAQDMKKAIAALEVSTRRHG